MANGDEVITHFIGHSRLELHQKFASMRGLRRLLAPLAKRPKEEKKG